MHFLILLGESICLALTQSLEQDERYREAHNRGRKYSTPTSAREGQEHLQKSFHAVSSNITSSTGGLNAHALGVVVTWVQLSGVKYSTTVCDQHVYENGSIFIVKLKSGIGEGER